MGLGLIVIDSALRNSGGPTHSLPVELRVSRETERQRVHLSYQLRCDQPSRWLPSAPLASILQGEHRQDPTMDPCRVAWVWMHVHLGLLSAHVSTGLRQYARHCWRTWRTCKC